MASQYELQLKATLDTSDVQQKLNQLRQSQGNASGGRSSGGIDSQRLNQTFTKIENTLNQLNKSIDRLSSSLSKGIGPAANNFGSRAGNASQYTQRAIQQVVSNMMVPMTGGRDEITKTINNTITRTITRTNTQIPNINAIQWLNSPAYLNYSKRVSRALASSGKKEAMAIELDLHKLPTIFDAKWVHEASKSGIVEKVLGKEFSKASYQSMLSQYYSTQRQMMDMIKKTPAVPPQVNSNTSSSSKTSINALLQNRKFGTIIGGQLLGGAADIASDFGYKQTGIVLGGLGKGITAGGSAAYTASLFGASDKASGRIGMAVGIATSAVQIAKGLYEFRDALQKATEAQREYAKTQYKEGLQLGKSRYGFFDTLLARDVLKTENTTIANERLKYSKITAQQQLDAYRKMEDPAIFSERIRKRAEQMKSDYSSRKSGWDSFSDAMSSMGYRLGLNDIADTPEAIDKAANKVIETYYKKFEDRGKEAQAAQSTVDLWQNVVDNLKEARNRAEDALSRMRQEEGRRKSAVVDQAYEQADAFRLNDKLQQSQMFALSIMRDRKLAPQAQFDKLSAELDKVREERNKKLQEAYGLNKDILLGKGKNAIEYEEMQTKRNKALQEAEGLASRAGVLENALASIKNLAIPPDFSHMTSLAQYGFNMGEREDTGAVMEKYYSKMTDLTKQIRDKLDQGITTTATYE